MKLPPDPVDFGATQDNQGNKVIWMRPNVLDDIEGEIVGLMGRGEMTSHVLGLIDEIKGAYKKDSSAMASDENEFGTEEERQAEEKSSRDAEAQARYLRKGREESAKDIADRLLEGFGNAGVASRPKQLTIKDVTIDRGTPHERFLPDNHPKMIAFMKQLSDEDKAMDSSIYNTDDEESPSRMGWVSSRGTP